MPVDDAPDDDSVRQSYNFAPGYHGLVYRADQSSSDQKHPQEDLTRDTSEKGDADAKCTTYKLQAMKWGELVPTYRALSDALILVRHGQASSLSGRSATPTMDL